MFKLTPTEVKPGPRGWGGIFLTKGRQNLSHKRSVSQSPALTKTPESPQLNQSPEWS